MKAKSKHIQLSDARRRESRRLSEDPVIMVVNGPIPYEVLGTLVDVSSMGFRAKHECKDLERGDRVRFRHKTKTGAAVVIWTRIVGSTIEAGFQITA